MDINLADHIQELVLATGAVGVASMGIAEATKSTILKPMGFVRLMKELSWAKKAFENTYSDDYLEMFEALYRDGRRKGELPRILRQAVRIGMDTESADTMAQQIVGVEGGDLKRIVSKLEKGDSLDDSERNILGRFEVAADARIDSAFSLADRIYKNGVRLRAFIIALLLSFVSAYMLGLTGSNLFTAFIVGITAVPIAPIAKDLASGLQSATKALGGRK